MLKAQEKDEKTTQKDDRSVEAQRRKADSRLYTNTSLTQYPVWFNSKPDERVPPSKLSIQQHGEAGERQGQNSSDLGTWE